MINHLRFSNVANNSLYTFQAELLATSASSSSLKSPISAPFLSLAMELLNPNTNFIAVIALIIVCIFAFATRSRSLVPKSLKGKSVISHSYCSDDDVSDDEDDADEVEEADSDEESEEEVDEKESEGQSGNFEWGFGNGGVVRLWEPEVHVTARRERGRVAVRVWDRRSAEREAASGATWRAEGEVVGVTGREERVYVSDDVGRVTAVDLRHVRATLGEICGDDGYFAFPPSFIL